MPRAKAARSMTEQVSPEAAIHEHVELVPYDRGRPRKFEAERTRLLSLFPNVFVTNEYFGSTAIPGMSAKPIIDKVGLAKRVSWADARVPRAARTHP